MVALVVTSNSSKIDFFVFQFVYQIDFYFRAWDLSSHGQLLYLPPLRCSLYAAASLTDEACIFQTGTAYFFVSYVSNKRAKAFFSMYFVNSGHRGKLQRVYLIKS